MQSRVFAALAMMKIATAREVRSRSMERHLLKMGFSPPIDTEMGRRPMIIAPRRTELPIRILSRSSPFPRARSNSRMPILYHSRRIRYFYYFVYCHADAAPLSLNLL